MKNVAIVRSHYPMTSEAFIAEQVRAYSSWSPIVITRSGRRDAQDVMPLRVDVSPLEARLIGAIPYVPARRHVDAARRCNLIHAHFGPDGVYARSLFRATGVPYVVTFHGYDVTLHGSALLRSMQPSKLHYLLCRSSIGTTASALIAVSKFVERRLLGLGLPKDKIHVHYIGVDVEKFQPSPTQPSAGPIRLLSVARLVDSKALDVAIRAVAEIVGFGVDCLYEIVGEGPLFGELSKLVQKLGLQNVVRFRGALGHDDVVDRMRGADIFLFPSRVSSTGAEEAFGIVLAEAAAVGLPIVACDVGGIAEVVRHGLNGYLVGMDDYRVFAQCIYRLATDGECRRTFSVSGRAMVTAEFDIRRQTEKLEHLYEELVRA